MAFTLLHSLRHVCFHAHSSYAKKGGSEIISLIWRGTEHCTDRRGRPSSSEEYVAPLAGGHFGRESKEASVKYIESSCVKLDGKLGTVGGEKEYGLNVDGKKQDEMERKR